MRIGALAQQLGTTTDAIRFYERRGLLPTPSRAENRYREYTVADSERLRILIGLRQLDLPLEQAAALASMCADGQCTEVSSALREAAAAKRVELRRRISEMRYLDKRLAQVESGLEAGELPRPLITNEKEADHGTLS
ncbi:MAG: MerR family transcriptional regulator [Tepidiformaceae bacterium]